MIYQALANNILELYKKHGHIEYGERCSQAAHAVQAGLIAQAKGFDEALILAAFLHDIGHLYPLDLAQERFQTMGAFGIEAHDQWGEKCLTDYGFSDRIIATVKNHVAAKRYLCFKDAEYYDQLSVASKQTLKYQGGPMTAAEAAHFEEDPFFKDSLLIRMVDELAKEQDFEILNSHWSYFKKLIIRQLKNSIRTDNL